MSWWPKARSLRRLVSRTRSGVVGSAAVPQRRMIPQLERLESRVVPARIVAVGGGLGSGSTVRIYIDKDGDGAVSDTTPQKGPTPVFADERSVYGLDVEVHVLLADIDGDGNDELITAPGQSSGANPGAAIKIFDLSPEGKIGDRVDRFMGFTSPCEGAWIAAGDFLGLGRDQIVVGAGPNLPGGAKVRIWGDIDGDGLISDETYIDQFKVYEPTFFGGVRVAVGNVNVQGASSTRLEIILAPGSGRIGEVLVLSDTNGDMRYSDNLSAMEVSEVFPGYFGGLYVASGNLTSSSMQDELVVGSDQGNPGTFATMAIYSDIDGDGAVLDNRTDLFTPFTQAGYSGGIRLAVGSLITGASQQLVFSAGPTTVGAPPFSRVRIARDADNDGTVSDAGSELDSFWSLPNYNGGTFVAVGSTNPGVVSAFYTVSTGTLPANIPDDGADHLVASIDVPARAGLIADLNVGLTIFHESNAALTVTLTHTSLTGVVSTFELFTGLGAGAGLQLILDDEAPTALSNSTTGSPVVGSFQPATDPLSSFDGLDAAGTWALNIDDGDVDTFSGSLFDFNLTFQYVR